MSGNILDVINSAAYDDESITRFEYHTHLPYNSTTYNNNDEIRIPINQQDIYTLPCESYLYIKIEYTNSEGVHDNTFQLVSNAAAFLFDEIRYEICGTEIDRVKNVGITTTLKNLLTIKPNEEKCLLNALWASNLIGMITPGAKEITCCIPLKMLLGFAEDYKRILLNVKQELVLIRASTDDNIVVVPQTVKQYKLMLKTIAWKMPYVHVSDDKRLELLKFVDRDLPISIPFRKWELYEYPSAPQAKQHTWTVKTSSQSEKPRYVIVGFQTDRKNNIHSNPSHFDNVTLRNIKLYLNSQYYPYDNINGDFYILYEYYKRFQSSYYFGSNNEPMITCSDFMIYAPLCVIDCSKQNDLLKTGSVDVRLEIETTDNIPNKTAIYCLIIYDTVIQYTPLSGTVRKAL